MRNWILLALLTFTTMLFSCGLYYYLRSRSRREDDDDDNDILGI